MIRERCIPNGPAFPAYTGRNRDLRLVRADAPGPTNREVEEERLQQQAGFSNVVRAIIDARVPVIGHNVWLDLCFLVNQTLGPLPSELHDFLYTVRQSFSSVIDTKVMAGRHGVRSS